MDENIDWSSPFNELTHGSDPVKTKEFSDAIERLCSYHYDKVSEFHINLKERGVWDEPVHIVPLMYEEIHSKFRASWMKFNDFSFHIVYDGRDKQTKAL